MVAYFLHSVSNKCMKTPCFIRDVSWDNFTVGPEELSDIFITQFFLQEGADFRGHHSGGEFKPGHGNWL